MSKIELRRKKSSDIINPNEMELFNGILQRFYPDFYSNKVVECVSIEKFLESEYYIGPEFVRIYDYWKDELTDLFNRGCSEWIVTGSLRSGKTSAAIIAVIRKLYELSIMIKMNSQNDRLHENKFLASVGGSIYMIYLSVSYRQAVLTGFGQLQSLLDEIPYFKEEFPRDNKINSILKFPSNVSIFAGSGGMHTIGTNLFGAILDEANFHHQAGSGEIAYHKIFSLYEDVIIRRKATFMQDGKDIGLSILATSSDTMTSFSEKRIEMCQGDKNVKITHAVVYRTKPVGTFSAEEFIVFKGTEIIDPCIINDFNTLISVLREINIEFKGSGEDLYSNYELLPFDVKESYFITVPIDFKKEFERDCVIALRKIAGVSTCAKTSFFKSVEAFNKNIYDDLVHPFHSEVFSLSTGDNYRIEDFFRPGLIKSFELNPEAERSVHIDLSVTGDSVGLAMCYVSDEVKFTSSFNRDIVVEKAVNTEVIQADISAMPIVTVEFMLKIKTPKHPHEIPLRRIREFFMYLSRVYDITFKKITFDQYQSRESIQYFTDAGIESDILSVDKNDIPHINLKNMLIENRIRMYNYSEFKSEWFSLIHDNIKKKVDHPSGGSKDVSDAVVGAVWNSIDGFCGLNSGYIRTI